MSLLDRSPSFEPITVFMQETTTDIDGNVQTRASTTGIPATARFQYQGQSGTSSRRQEQDSEGYESEQIYSMRLPRAWHAQYGPLGPQAEIEWQGVRWGLYGHTEVHNASPRTAHFLYNVKRS